jgi:hypothetical protein
VYVPARLVSNVPTAWPERYPARRTRRSGCRSKRNPRTVWPGHLELKEPQGGQEGNTLAVALVVHHPAGRCW